MNKHLILISHGLFCEELKKSTEMIMGQQDIIHTVSLLPSEGPDDFKKKLLDVIEPLEDFVVLADLMGGTPANVASSLLLNGKDFKLYVGMNMPMVIGFLNNVLIGADNDIKEPAKEGILLVNDIILAAEDDE